MAATSQTRSLAVERRTIASEIDAALAVAVAGVSLALYARTLAPDVLGGDAGELQFVPWILSLAHPTGYPLQTLLGHLWARLLPWGTVAWRANLLSAAAGSAGVALLYGAARGYGATRGAALLAALALGADRGWPVERALRTAMAAAALWVSRAPGTQPDWGTLSDLAEQAAVTRIPLVI